MVQMAGTSVMTSPSRTSTGTCFLGLMRWKSGTNETVVALTVLRMEVNERLDSWRRMCGQVEHAMGAQ